MPAERDILQNRTVGGAVVLHAEPGRKMGPEGPEVGSGAGDEAEGGDGGGEEVESKRSVQGGEGVGAGDWGVEDKAIFEFGPTEVCQSLACAV
jgi:hypothetical protein